MPLGDVTEQQAFISSYFGADASRIPASFDVAIYTGDPYNGGVEFAYPGYARVTLTNDLTTFVDNSDGSSTATASFPDATGAATTDDGAVWVLFNGTAIVAWEFLDQPVEVDGAGVVGDIEVTVYHPNSTNVAS
jgi:hypothetical protein